MLRRVDEVPHSEATWVEIENRVLFRTEDGGLRGPYARSGLTRNLLRDQTIDHEAVVGSIYVEVESV